MVAQRLAARLITYTLLITLGLVFFFPFYFMTVASVMRMNEIFSVYPHLLPAEWRFDSYELLFRERPFARNMLNSAVVATIQTFGMVLLSAMAGFAFAKSRFPGRERLFLFVLATMMLPNQIQIIPLYEIMSALGWRNTYFSLIVPWLASAFGIFLLRQYIAMSLPDELVDAATIDGCSFVGTFTRICLPVVKPGLTVLVLLGIVDNWNSFLWPFLMLDKPVMQTVTVALGTLHAARGSMDPIFRTAILAGTVVGTMPLVIIFLLAQRLFVSGIMSGAFKGGAH
jgi:ABC-type glycerol-3-phosphate transport system permease component